MSLQFKLAFCLAAATSVGCGHLGAQGVPVGGVAGDSTDGRGSEPDYGSVTSVDQLLKLVPGGFLGCEAMRGLHPAMKERVWAALGDVTQFPNWETLVQVFNTAGDAASILRLVAFAERGYQGTVPVFDHLHETDRVWLAFYRAIFAIGLIGARLAEVEGVAAAEPAVSFLLACADHRHWSGPQVTWTDGDARHLAEGRLDVGPYAPTTVSTLLAESCLQALGFFLEPHVVVRAAARRAELVAGGVWVGRQESGYAEADVIRNTVRRRGGVVAHQRWRHSGCRY